MHISQIHLENFRGFKKNTILFQPGINVLIGHNNAGKTNLLRALQIVFDRTQQRLSIEDFNATINDFTIPPQIEINVTIKETIDAPGTNNGEDPEDKNVVYNWLVNEAQPYEAKLTYRFYLPFKHHADFTTEVNRFRNPAGVYDAEQCFKVIDKKFLRKYIAVVYGGDEQNEEKAGSENLDRFDFQFLDAIRDAERQMFYGNNTLLRDVLNYFLDYDLTEGKDFEQLTNEKKLALQTREQEFAAKTRELLELLISRVSKQEILAYSRATGAEKGGNPNFDANISEQQLLFALRLIVEKSGFKLPIKNNGLGYNNLLFIALIMARMQMERSSFMGDNAKIFPILAIEEPEAHLHPSMQYKFLKFLDTNIHTQKQARQAFITTHSTQITAAVDLDSIVCLYEDFEGHQRVSYPGRVFTTSPEDQESKAYVRRFLDATKSNMLFSDRVVFVEGLAEQLLLPCFAAYLNVEDSLINMHTAIVSVDGTSFKHFLKLFAFEGKPENYCLRRKVVCITDADPSHRERKNEEEEEDHRRHWKSCYPFQLETEPEKYHYSPLTSHAKALIAFAKDFDHIKIATPIQGTGKTLEYELANFNPDCSLLLTKSFPTRGKNKKSVLEQLMTAIKEAKELDELLAMCQHQDIKDWLALSTWEGEHKKKALLAACYHRAIEASKGEHAFLLEQQLRQNLLNEGDAKVAFNVPTYIADSITFITE
ncbi:AAA family ATPase [Mucilaginibacter sp. SMC90]|uniref:ATP-dependent nuclease n=1 Tax=Mucilaginibacter sp. SMC90 TaxID=2929803 RepID=UPI001FB499C0|nr:AAA family ATPase [Mucilaginibacter sp. SMC90]UOE51372.1 AAA family ATPase [Mucilaginibacter sp. SMC90]